MKKVINCKITKRQALLATIEQQVKEQQQLALQINNMVLERLTLTELKEVIKLNAKSNNMLKEVMANPDNFTDMVKNGLKFIKTMF